MSTLTQAILIATEAHRHQVDKGQAPYILHPLRVMLAQKDTAAQIVAVLHDVVEDAPEWSLERLRQEGFAEDVLAAVDALTKRPDEQRDGEDGYLRFVARAAANPLARPVKLADLLDNCDTSRLGELTPEDQLRLDKYAKAIALLQSP